MRLQKRRVFASGVLGLGAALVLAGCGAGQITQTDTMLPAVNGALAQVGNLSIRNASVAGRDGCEQAYPAGSNAPLTLTIANAGGQDDELVSVSSENAASATVQGQQTVVAGSTLVVGPADRGESAAASSSSPATGQSSSLGHASVVLQGLKSVLWPGQLTTVTFVFRGAGAVTTQLPVASPAKVLDCQTAVQQAEGGGH